ncbi:MAG: hypothetical protein IT487_07785 [Chromatiaceae bacterium]|nr:hypothetical protein [Chromatiaceae bacterium]
MDKPNYLVWDAVSVFTPVQAAALCCDIQPDNWNDSGRAEIRKPTPQVVLAMADTLQREAEPDIKQTGSWEYRGRVQARTKTTFHRHRLRAWAEATGHLAAMPFLLTPEERAIPTPQPGPASVRRADAESNLYALVGLLSLALAERGGNMRIPRQGGHRFHAKLDSDSTASWPPVPGQAGHLK